MFALQTVHMTEMGVKGWDIQCVVPEDGACICWTCSIRTVVPAVIRRFFGKNIFVKAVVQKCVCREKHFVQVAENLGHNVFAVQICIMTGRVW